MGGAAMENNGSGGESAPSVGASKKGTDFFPNKSHVTDGLRTILAHLDASDPTLVYEKHMPPSDRSKGQNRLLMSCKCESKRASFASIFTETEMPLVHLPEPLKTEDDNNDDHGSKDKASKGKKKDGGENNNCKKGCRNNNAKHKTKGGSEEDGMGEHENKWSSDKADNYEDEDDECSIGEEDTDDHQQGKQKSTVIRGLAVQAYDRDGREYELNLKYLSSNTAYRIIGPDYAVFLDNNGLLVGGGGVARKRSAGRQKRRRSISLPDEEEPDDEQPAVRDADDDIQIELWAFRSPKLSIGVKGQPAGALGLLLLHYRGGEGDAGQVRVGDAAATEEVQQVAAPQDQEVVVVVEQRQQKSHGNATQGEGMVAAGDCGGEDAATVVDDAAGKLGDAAPRSTLDMPLRPVERLIAVFLSYDDHSHTDVNDNGGEADANDNCTCKQGPK